MVKLFLGSFIIGAIIVMTPFFIDILRFIWEEHRPFTAFVLTVGWIMCILPLLIAFVIYIFNMGG